MMVIPAVSGVRETWQAGRVLSLNLGEDVNREYAARVGATESPTFILFDRAGKEQRRWVGTAPAPGDLPTE